MHPIQQQLYVDHHHFQRLLEALERQLALLLNGGFNHVDLARVLEALEYIRLYPEKWHHPSEDIVFALLRERGVASAAVVQAIADDHQSLERLTERVNRLFMAVANDAVVPTQQLTAALETLIKCQRSHIEQENEQIYPLMSQYLSAQDWEQIAAQVGAARDPLFGPQLKSEYQNLYHHVVTYSEDDWGAYA